MKNRKLGLVLLASAILTATYIPTSRASADTTQLKQTNVIKDAGQTTETAKLSDSENNQFYLAYLKSDDCLRLPPR